LAASWAWALISRPKDRHIPLLAGLFCLGQIVVWALFVTVHVPGFSGTPEPNEAIALLSKAAELLRSTTSGGASLAAGDDGVRRRTLGVVLIAVGLAGLIGTAWAFAARPGVRGGSICNAPALPGQMVDVTLSDMGGMMGGRMMGGGHMMNVAASPSTVAAGAVSFRVWNAGMMVHEFVVLPLSPAGAGTRPIGPDGRVSEAGSRGEASKSCGAGAGDGMAPGAGSWVPLDLAPGRYELICNLPGHYAMGMHAELAVRP